MYKKLTILAILFFLSIVSMQGQNIQLIMNPKPSPYISDWSTHIETASLIISNATNADIKVKVKTEIFDGTGSLVAYNDLSKMPVLSVPPGVTTYHAEDIFPLPAANYKGKLGNISKTGRIPDDHYQICVSLKNPISGDPMGTSGTVCKLFTIVAYQAPSLITPANNSVIEEKDSRGIFFRWTPVIPSPPTIATYRLQIWEVLEGQTNMIALRANQPIVDKEIKGTLQTQWPIDFPMPESNRKYVWTITPLDDEGRNIVDGNGFAEPFGFSIDIERQTRSMTNSTSPDSVQSKSVRSRQSGSLLNHISFATAAVGDTIKAGLNGEFKVIVSEIADTAGSLTGKGKVYIGWLLVNVAVEFKNINIDATKRLTSGGIVSSQGATSTSYQGYPQAWAECLLSGPGVTNVVDHVMAWTNDHVDNLENWVNTNVSLGQPKLNYNVPNPIPQNNSLKMPFGLKFPISSNSQELVITEMVFKPNESKINFLAQVSFAKSNATYNLGFAGKYFLMHPTRIDFKSGRVELAEDFTLPNVTSSPKMKFTFIKGSPNNGCFAKWDSAGLDTINIALKVKFTRAWFLPVPRTNDSVAFMLTGNATSMHDIILTGSFPDFEITGTNGIKVQHDSISLDLSDIRNPLNINFPSNYPGLLPNMNEPMDWQGFHIPSLNLTLPDAWKTNAGGVPQITVHNIIIDDFGLTAKIFAKNIITFQSGKVADLSASLDTIDISIVKSSLVSGIAKGKLVLPISKDAAKNTLKYTATFASKNFQIVIVPAGPIDADVLKGTMTLDATSNITALKTPDSLTLSISLNGSFSWDNPDLSVPSLGIPSINGIKMELDFEDLGMTYTHYPGATPYSLDFSIGNWSFASPQKLLANFPVTIKHVRYKSFPNASLTSPNMELLNGAIMFDVVANLTEEIGGTTTLGAKFALDFDKSAIKFTPTFKGVFVDSIEVHSDMPAVKIDGYLKIFTHDPVFGDGFIAQLGVTFTAVSLSADALVQFGNTTNLNNGQYYRYWRVETDVDFQPGIPFLPGVGFYGFGGGAYYNMTKQVITSPKAIGTKYVFTPKKGGWGFEVKARIATLPKFKTFNMDASLSAQFQGSAITYIDFNGDFWLAAEVADRPKSQIMGNVYCDYDFTSKVFWLGASLKLQVTENGQPGGTPVITTSTSNPIAFALLIDGRNNLWYFKFGTPTHPASVDVFGINLYTYLMFGNCLAPDVPDGFTPNFISNYTSNIGSPPGTNHSTGGADAPGTVGNTSTGKGIATGVGIEFDKPYSYNIHRGECRQWSIDAKLNVGAELNIAFLDQVGCAGINGYRVSGDVALYFHVTTEIKGICFACTGWPLYYGDIDYKLFEIQVGVWLTGEFPKPVYLSGGVNATIGVFDDLLKVHFTESFSYGTHCAGNTVVTANAAQEDKAADLKNKLIQYVAPPAQNNLPVSSTINVKYAFVPDTAFDVAENQGDGTIKQRTFKLVETTSLEVLNANGNWTPLPLLSSANNIGEWQYYLHAPSVDPKGTGVAVKSTKVSKAVLVNKGTQGFKDRLTQAESGALTTHTATEVTPINTNNGNNMLASNGQIIVASDGTSLIPAIIPPPPQPDYPNPIQAPVNHLEVYKEYRFIVTASLMELTPTQVLTTGPNAGRGTGYHTELLWRQAYTRNGGRGDEIRDTKTVLYKTGIPPVTANANNQFR